MSNYATLLTTTPHGNALLSGGNVGPEGSLLGLAVPLLLALVLNKIYPSIKFPWPTGGVRFAEKNLEF
jgi:hypothetical protein